MTTPSRADRVLGMTDEKAEEPTPEEAPANRRPKDVYTEQMRDAELDSWGEGARRDLLKD